MAQRQQAKFLSPIGVIISENIPILGGGHMHYGVQCELSRSASGVYFKIIKEVTGSPQELVLNLSQNVGQIVLESARSRVMLTGIQSQGGNVLINFTFRLDPEDYRDMVGILKVYAKHRRIKTLVRRCVGFSLGLSQTTLKFISIGYV